VEEEDRKQKVAAKEVERQLEKVRKAEESEKKRLEEAECERKRIELVKRQELEERQKLDAEKKMISEMKQQLMEKAQLLEEKERQLKIEEDRRMQEEVKRKKDEQSRKEEIKKIEENRKEEELKRCEEYRLKQEELKNYEESRKEELHMSEEKSAEKSIESSVSKGKRTDREKDDLKTEDELENKKEDSDQKKLAILAKEKKLRDEAEFKKKGTIKKTKIMKQVLKSSEEMTMLSEKSPVEPELDEKVVKEHSSCLSDLPRQEMLSQPSKAKSPGRKPTKYLKLTEAEMREKQKKEIMEAKIAKRKLMVEQRIQNAEATRGKARAQMEKYENDKMDKMLRKSIKSAEANLTSSALEETLESVSGQNNSEYMSRSDGSNPDLGNKFDDSISRPENLAVIPPKVAEPIPDPESPQLKKKTIRIGRRPPKKAACINDAPKVEEVEPLTVNEVQVESVIEFVDETDNLPNENNSEETDEKSSNPEGRRSNVETVGEILPLTNSHVDEKKEESAPVDDTCSESVLYPAVSTRRRSQCPPPVPETVQSKSRTSKRKPVAVVLQEESPPKKVKNTDIKAVTGADKPKRGRKKHVVGVPEIVILAEEEGDQEVKEPDDDGKEKVIITKEKVKVSRNKNLVTRSINPPVVHDESSLHDKLEKRRKRIDDTIKNPETAISAFKISKKVATPVKITSLEKKLSKQRKVVEEATEEEESQNPTPVKSLARLRRNGDNKNIVDAMKKRESIAEEESPPKKTKGVTGRIGLKNKIALPEVHQDSSLFEKLDKRRKKMEEPFNDEELTFANKFNKKTAVQLTESLEKKLTKQRNKADRAEGDLVPEKQTDNEESAKVTKKAGKVSKASKAKDSKFEKKVGKLSTRKSSEEQDYYTAAEDSILSTRPRRNCKKKFVNLEGLASSSVSNTPTPVPEEADKSRQIKFQFPASSKAPEIVPDDKPAKKRPGRKPAKAARTAPELSVGDETPPNTTSVEVIVHPPDESRSDTPKLAKTRKPKHHQEVSESAKKSKESIDENITTEKSKTVPRNANSRRTKAQIRGALISMDDEVYKTPSTKIPDEVYQTPRPMGSFSEVLDEEYKTPEETIRKPRRTRKK